MTHRRILIGKHAWLAMILTVLSVSHIQAQNRAILTNTLAWAVDHSIELHSGETSMKSCSIVTRQVESIYLVSAQDSLTFTVTTVSGTWSDHSLEGSLHYAVTYQDVPGEIVIRRNAEGVSILIDFTESDPQAMKRRFMVTTITELP